jgi:hypothetical protein
MRTITYTLCAVAMTVMLTACQTTTTTATTAPTITTPAVDEYAPWVPLIKGNSLDGWTARGNAEWRIEDGVIIGQSPGGQGHLYAEPVLTDLEVKGEFRVTSQGKDANSGLYFRANPPEDNPDGYPRGYEAQISNTHDAYTGWLWKPGSPTGEASELLTQDGEWFTMKVRAVGNNITIWINGTEVMNHQDNEYKKGQFAIQCHNELMTVEARELYYRDLS